MLSLPDDMIEYLGELRDALAHEARPGDLQAVMRESNAVVIRAQLLGLIQ